MPADRLDAEGEMVNNLVCDHIGSGDSDKARTAVADAVEPRLDPASHDHQSGQLTRRERKRCECPRWATEYVWSVMVSGRDAVKRLTR